MRRLTHYDYWQDCLRRPILCDSGADLLVCFEIRMMDITDYSPDGTLTPATRGVSQYALISTEDFLASRPGYRTLQTDHPLTM